MKKPLFFLPFLILPGCGLEAECYAGRGDILIAPLTFKDVAPLGMLCVVALLMLVQAPLLTWCRTRKRRRNLFTAALSWCGFTMGLSLLPLLPALYEDTFFPHIAGPLNPGKAIFVLLEITCPLMLAGILLVAFVSFCRWMWLNRKAA